MPDGYGERDQRPAWKRNEALQRRSWRLDRHSAELVTTAGCPRIRLTVQPTPQNGLLKPSQIQIDKAMSVQRHRVGSVIGRLDDASMLAVTRSLALFLRIA